MSVMATRVINKKKVFIHYLIDSNRTRYDLRLTMKQLVTLFNFSNRIATHITKLLPNRNHRNEINKKEEDLVYLEYQQQRLISRHSQKRDACVMMDHHYYDHHPNWYCYYFE